MYLETAQREHLDFAIGSKRHPDSQVVYPRSRRLASWGYQQMNRVLFRLDVRDTQVGLKVFSRDVADNVVPLLLVKQFAFDLELLAVARAFGYRRVRELPVRLDYRFTGSEVRSKTVARALWDTAAVFYRLRILRTYQRRQRAPRARHEQRRSASSFRSTTRRRTSGQLCTPSCARSAQSAFDTEVVLVDDGSTDGSADVARSALQR